MSPESQSSLVSRKTLYTNPDSLVTERETDRQTERETETKTERGTERQRDTGTRSKQPDASERHSCDSYLLITILLIGV